MITKKHLLEAVLRFLLLVTCTLTSHVLIAQEIIDEDFIERLGNNAKPLWNDTENAFTVNTVPQKWNSESAVIIGYKRSILFDKQSRRGFFSSEQNNVFFYEKVHFKIKLQDKNSVQSFSELYFRYENKEDGFAARIIKPDGTIQSIDLKGAAGVESRSDVPEFFKSFFDNNYTISSKTTFYKVAVPDIEPGDILEYVSNTKSGYNVTNGEQWVQFEPQYEMCSKKYPIMYNEIDIETDNYTYFKSLATNGAPEFKKENTKDDGYYRYVFIDKDRGTVTDVNFVNPYLIYPMVKFQVIFSKSKQAKGLLIGEKGELKTGFSKEELARKAWENYEDVGDLNYDYLVTLQKAIDDSWFELEKIGQKTWPDEQFITNCYYYLRYKQIIDNNYLSDKKFAYFFGSLLFQRDIKSDLIISISNRIGSIEQVLFSSEMRYVIKVNDKLYFNNTNFSNPEDLVENLLGNDAYIISEPPKDGGKQEIKPINLPTTKPEDNTASYSLQVDIDPAMGKLLVSRTSTYTGLSKTDNIASALKYTFYSENDYRLFDGTPPSGRFKKNDTDLYNRLTKQLKEENTESKPEYIKKQLENEFEQKVNFRSFDLVNDGRSNLKPVLSFVEDFDIADNIKRAGKKYLINIMGLTGSQLHIKPKERDRKNDINLGYPRTITWDISFKIPKGYAIDGLKELNQKVENETGEYSCTAKEENGTLKMNIVKKYKQSKIEKNKWNDVLTVIDSAYNNSFKYILLKPEK